MSKKIIFIGITVIILISSGIFLFIQPNDNIVTDPQGLENLTPNQQIPSHSENTQKALESRICQASDTASFKGCANKVNNNQADDIKITGLITCVGKDTCGVELKNLKRPVSIYGQNPDYGFRRLDAYNYYLISVTNSEGIKINNLSFDENENQPCAPLTDSDNCQGTILISDSNDILIDKVSINHSKKEAVQIYNSKKIVITNSKFINSYLFGVILNNPMNHDTGYLAITSARVENNLFKDIKSNALVLYQMQAAESDPIVVRGNTFINNHRENVYFLCEESGKEPCPGGQLYLTNDVANVKIENNIIKDGKSKIGTGGIEFSNFNIRNVDVVGNEIYNNNMWGIYINPNASNVSDIFIRKNKIYNNGLLPQYRGVNISIPSNTSVVESGNCFTLSCTP